MTHRELPQIKQPLTQKIRHVKSGEEYEVIAGAYLQTDRPISDYEPLVIYKGKEGRYWVRPEKEFTPDRFVVVDTGDTDT